MNDETHHHSIEYGAVAVAVGAGAGSELEELSR